MEEWDKGAEVFGHFLMCQPYSAAPREYASGLIRLVMTEDVEKELAIPYALTPAMGRPSAADALTTRLPAGLLPVTPLYSKSAQPDPDRSGRSRALLLVLLLSLMAGLGAGCSAPTYFLEGEELARFEAAGPVEIEVDTDRILRSMRDHGPYRLVAGDLLRVVAPDALFDEEGERGVNSPSVTGRLARVGVDGRIVLGVLGPIEAAGKTLAELEIGIASAAHPRYLQRRPAVVAQVERHFMRRVTVVGAVTTPGIVELKSDELTLYGALAAAGGIAKSGNLVVGARLIRILQPGEAPGSGEVEAEDEGAGELGKENAPILLPVRGLNVPEANVALRGGEVIEVERYEPDTFTVTGLVKRPGAHQYPPEVTYNLMQAIAIAGGVETVANPPYATIFRKAADGTILPATFDIAGNGLVQSSGLRIKPGDVIVIGHTTASWTRALIAEVLRFNVGFYVDPQNL
jgi:polysaccharide export outer membrane protein